MHIIFPFKELLVHLFTRRLCFSIVSSHVSVFISKNFAMLFCAVKDCHHTTIFVYIQALFHFFEADILYYEIVGKNMGRHVGQEHTLLYYATQSVVRALTSGSRAHPNISLPFFF